MGDVTHDGSDLKVLLRLSSDLGWYFFPVYGSTRPQEAKRPVLHEVRHWPTQSSNEPSVVASWASGTGYGLALDCGRSDVVVLDADRPQECAGLDLQDAWAISGHPQRRAFIFDQPPERIGCRTSGWKAGEVKGDGGYIVMPPSFHLVGGAYRWISRRGSRVMPDSIRSLVKSPDGAPLAPLAGCLTSGESCRRLRFVVRRYGVILRDPTASRHDAVRNGMTEIMMLGARGHEGSEAALKVLRIAYLLSVRGDRSREQSAEADFQRLLADRPMYLATQTVIPETCRGPLCGG